VNEVEIALYIETSELLNVTIDAFKDEFCEFMRLVNEETDEDKLINELLMFITLLFNAVDKFKKDELNEHRFK
jgi:hypothetical protein